MNGILNRINLMISRYLSNRLFMREQGILLGVMACMLAAGSFSAAFINTYLYSFANTAASDGLYTVAKYNLLTAVSLIVFCSVVGILAKKLTYKVSMTIGAAIHILFYVCVVVLAENLQSYIGFIAMLSGMGTAFFYISYNSLVNVMIGSVARKQYIMFQSIISMAVGIVFPLVSGAIIHAINSVAGYILVFLICILLSLVCMILCIMLPKVRGQSRRTFFAGVLLKSFVSKRYLAVSVCDCLRGLKEGIIMFLLPVIIIRATGNVFVVGIYVAVCALAGILGNLALQRVNVMKYPYMSMLSAILVQFAAIVFLTVKFNIWMMFAAGIVNAFFVPAAAAAANAHYYSALAATDANLSKKTLETTCVKEIYYNVGKIAAILVLSLTITNTFAMFITISVFFALQLTSWVLCLLLRKSGYEMHDA